MNPKECKWCMNGKHCSKYRCVCIAIEYGEAQSACPDFIRKDNKNKKQ